MDFSIIAKKTATSKVVKPVLEIAYGDNCSPCIRLHAAYFGEKSSKTVTRLRQFLDARYEVRWVKYDRSEIERRRYQTLAAATGEDMIPLFAVDGGKAHWVGFSDAESLMAALTAKKSNPVPIRPGS